MPVGASARGRAAARRLAVSDRLARWVFISGRLRELFRETVALPDARCLVEHDAVDLERFTPPAPAVAARRRLGLAAERPLVVYCGQLYPGRGAELLLDVAAAAPGLDVLLVGGQPEDVERLRAAAATRGLGNVRLTGHRSVGELPGYLFAADVLVMPHTTRSLASDRATAISDYASPMKLFEYMAAGRAIVATRFPSVTEVLRDGETGVLVPPDDPAALRDAVVGLAGDPVRAARLGAAARAAVEPHTWLRRARRILEGI
jgi:glycosyltransferase involved in cell wall biosynthesis